jgi:Histidine kinase-like ATPase domain
MSAWLLPVTAGAPPGGPAGPGDGAAGGPGGMDRWGPAILDRAFDAGTLSALRASARAYAAEAGMSAERADDVVIAVHELAANVIVHGAGVGRLRMGVVAGGLRCRVDDDGVPAPGGGTGQGAGSGGQGAGTAGRAARDPADPWSYLPGHGLWVVRLVADQMSVASGPAGSGATVIFALPSGDASADAPGRGAGAGSGEGSGEPGPRWLCSCRYRLAGGIGGVRAGGAGCVPGRDGLLSAGLRSAGPASVRVLLVTGTTLRDRGGRRGP